MNRQFQGVKGKVGISGSRLKINVKTAEIFNGILKGTGTVNTDKTSFAFDARLKNINLAHLLSSYSEDVNLTGNADFACSFKSAGNSEEEILKNLDGSGKFNAENGELFGSAHFLKAVFGVAKLANLFGPSGKSTEYKKMSFYVNISKSRIDVNKFKLHGVGMDADGRGYFYLNRKLRFRILVKMSGNSGKIFQIPIIYNGKYPAAIPYVDPIWLGSVIFTGPLGLLIGPALSRYYNNFFKF